MFYGSNNNNKRNTIEAESKIKSNFLYGQTFYSPSSSSPISFDPLSPLDETSSSNSSPYINHDDYEPELILIVNDPEFDSSISDKFARTRSMSQSSNLSISPHLIPNSPNNLSFSKVKTSPVPGQLRIKSINRSCSFDNSISRFSPTSSLYKNSPSPSPHSPFSPLLQSQTSLSPNPSTSKATKRVSENYHLNESDKHIKNKKVHDDKSIYDHKGRVSSYLKTSLQCDSTSFDTISKKRKADPLAAFHRGNYKDKIFLVKSLIKSLNVQDSQIVDFEFKVLLPSNYTNEENIRLCNWLNSMQFNCINYSSSCYKYDLCHYELYQLINSHYKDRIKDQQNEEIMNILFPLISTSIANSPNSKHSKNNRIKSLGSSKSSNQIDIFNAIHNKSSRRSSDPPPPNFKGPQKTPAKNQRSLSIDTSSTIISGLDMPITPTLEMEKLNFNSPKPQINKVDLKEDDIIIVELEKNKKVDIDIKLNNDKNFSFNQSTDNKYYLSNSQIAIEDESSNSSINLNLENIDLNSSYQFDSSLEISQLKSSDKEIQNFSSHSNFKLNDSPEKLTNDKYFSPSRFQKTESHLNFSDQLSFLSPGVSSLPSSSSSLPPRHSTISSNQVHNSQVQSFLTSRLFSPFGKSEKDSSPYIQKIASNISPVVMKSSIIDLDIKESEIDKRNISPLSSPKASETPNFNNLEYFTPVPSKFTMETWFHSNGASEHKIKAFQKHFEYHKVSIDINNSFSPNLAFSSTNSFSKLRSNCIRTLPNLPNISGQNQLVQNFPLTYDRTEKDLAQFNSSHIFSPQSIQTSGIYNSCSLYQSTPSSAFEHSQNNYHSHNSNFQSPFNKLKHSEININISTIFNSSRDLDLSCEGELDQSLDSSESLKEFSSSKVKKSNFISNSSIDTLYSIKETIPTSISFPQISNDTLDTLPSPISKTSCEPDYIIDCSNDYPLQEIFNSSNQLHNISYEYNSTESSATYPFFSSISSTTTTCESIPSFSTLNEFQKSSDPSEYCPISSNELITDTLQRTTSTMSTPAPIDFSCFFASENFITLISQFFSKFSENICILGGKFNGINLGTKLNQEDTLINKIFISSNEMEDFNHDYLIDSLCYDFFKEKKTIHRSPSDNVFSLPVFNSTQNLTSNSLANVLLSSNWKLIHVYPTGYLIISKSELSDNQIKDYLQQKTQKRILKKKFTFFFVKNLSFITTIIENHKRFHTSVSESSEISSFNSLNNLSYNFIVKIFSFLDMTQLCYDTSRVCIKFNKIIQLMKPYLILRNQFNRILNSSPSVCLPQALFNDENTNNLNNFEIVSINYLKKSDLNNFYTLILLKKNNLIYTLSIICYNFFDHMNKFSYILSKIYSTLLLFNNKNSHIFFSSQGYKFPNYSSFEDNQEGNYFLYILTPVDDKSSSLSKTNYNFPNNTIYSSTPSLILPPFISSTCFNINNICKENKFELDKFNIWLKNVLVYGSEFQKFPSNIKLPFNSMSLIDRFNGKNNYSKSFLDPLLIPYSLILKNIENDNCYSSSLFIEKIMSCNSKKFHFFSTFCCPEILLLDFSCLNFDSILSFSIGSMILRKLYQSYISNDETLLNDSHFFDLLPLKCPLFLVKLISKHLLCSKSTCEINQDDDSSSDESSSSIMTADFLKYNNDLRAHRRRSSNSIASIDEEMIMYNKDNWEEDTIINEDENFFSPTFSIYSHSPNLTNSSFSPFMSISPIENLSGRTDSINLNIINEIEFPTFLEDLEGQIDSQVFEKSCDLIYRFLIFFASSSFYSNLQQSFSYSTNPFISTFIQFFYSNKKNYDIKNMKKNPDIKAAAFYQYHHDLSCFNFYKGSSENIIKLRSRLDSMGDEAWKLVENLMQIDPRMRSSASEILDLFL